MKRKPVWLSTIAAVCITASGVMAQVEISGNVALASDYPFRGISQTLEKPAVQGGLDAVAPFGLYAGLWASSVNFGEDLAAGPRAQMELDVYGGIGHSVAGLDLDAGLLYYGYPGAESDRNYDFFEVYAGVARALGPVSLDLSGAYSPDFFAASGSALWGSLSGGWGLPGLPVTLDGSVGMQTIEDNGAFGTPDYMTWSAGLSTEVLGTSIGGSLLGTDLEKEDCFGGMALCETRVVVSVSRSL